VATTRLSPAGFPGRPYGSFTHGPTSGAHSGTFTRLSPPGVPGRLYGSFAGRSVATEDTKTSSLSVVPRVTIGDVTDVDVENWFSAIPRVTLSSAVRYEVASSLSLVPRVTQARGAVTSSSFNKPSSASAVPVVTIAVSHLSKTFDSTASLIPVVTLSNSVDTGADTLEATSDHSLIPVVTLSSSVDDINQSKSNSQSLIPVATLTTQVQRYTATVPWDIPFVVAPRVTLSINARISGDVDCIDISARPCGYIEITRV
jgi:hypothetical protein